MTSFGRLRLIHHHRHLVATRLILWLLCAALINLLCLNVMMIALMRYCAHFPVALIIAIMYLLPAVRLDSIMYLHYDCIGSSPSVIIYDVE